MSLILNNTFQQKSKLINNAYSKIIDKGIKHQLLSKEKDFDLLTYGHYSSNYNLTSNGLKVLNIFARYKPEKQYLSTLSLPKNDLTYTKPATSGNAKFFFKAPTKCSSNFHMFLSFFFDFPQTSLFFIKFFVCILLLFSIIFKKMSIIKNTISKGIYHKDFLFSFVFFFTPSLETFNNATNTLNISNETEYKDREEYKSQTQYLMISGIKIIQSRAFTYWSGLVSVQINEPITKIEGSAFEGCTSLKNITISNTVNSIGTNVFIGCSGLEFINVSDGNNNYYKSDNGILYDWNISTLICYPAGITNETFKIPNTVTIIDTSAFYGCCWLKNITIPWSVTIIKEFAFYQCNLEIVLIGENVETINSNAFIYCKSLKNITIPKSVTFIGLGVFKGCSSLQFINVSKENKNYSNSDNGVLYDKNFTTIVYYPIGITNKTSEMPETVNTIGNYAFSGFLITKFIIPESVTMIGSFAFGYCFNLETVIIGENVNTIDDHAFFECSLLTNITIPDSVISIGNYAFQSCNNLTTVIIGKNVTSIGGSAFQCKNLKCIYFTGYQHPIEIDPNSFVDAPAKYVMTSDLYQNITFGNLSVSKGSSIEDCETYQWPTHPFTNSFSNSDTFTKPNTFSNTYAITKSNSFTKSNTFADLSHFPTTFSFSYILTKTYSITQTLTLHNKFSTHSFTFTYTDSISTYINSQFIYYEYSIYQYSTYYFYYSNYFTIFPQTKTQENQIPTNVLIGIICGSVIVILLIIGIIIFVIRKGQNNISKSTSNVPSKSSSYNISENVDKGITNLINNETDNWI